MITLKSVATEAMVSVATASRALRNIGYISEDTKNRVSNAAKKLGYVVDMGAQQLRNGKSMLVGIIVSDIENFFYNMTLSILEAKLKKIGCMLLLTYSNENSEEERKSFKTLISAKVSTIIFTPVTNKNLDLIKQATDYNIKVIQLYRKVYNSIEAITFDDEIGANLAATHLIEVGCKRPMLIGVKYLNFDSDLVVLPRRETGFLRAINDNKIKNYQIFNHELIAHRENELEQAILLFKPDGIIAGTNIFAVELLEILKRNNITFPGDIKIVTFDDIGWVSYINLSAIRQPVEFLANILYDKIILQNSDNFVKISPSLIIRASSKPSHPMELY